MNDLILVMCVCSGVLREGKKLRMRARGIREGDISIFFFFFPPFFCLLSLYGLGVSFICSLTGEHMNMNENRNNDMIRR